MTATVQPQNLLAPRRISYVKVGLAILLFLAMVSGIWYVYAAQQSRTVATQPPGTAKPLTSQGTGISTEKLAYDPPKSQTLPPIPPNELNGKPAEDPGLVDRLMTRIGELEAQVNTKMTQVYTPPEKIAQIAPQARPSPTPTTPNPAIAIKAKALAESRKAPMVVISTNAKVPEDSEGARTLQPGWKIPFLVETAVHSDVGSEFTARVSETVYASGAHQMLVIPSGATVMGSSRSAQLVPGNERLPMIGVTLSIPKMKPIDLGSMPITDQEGRAGMVDEIENHYVRMGLGVLVGGVIRGATRVVQTESQRIGSVGSIGEGVAQGAQQAASPQIQQLYSVKPTIQVFRGSRGYILVTKSLTIPRLPGGQP